MASILRQNAGEWSALAAWALVVVVVLIAAAPLDAFTQFGPGPGFFPRALCAVLGALTIAQAVLVLKQQRACDISGQEADCEITDPASDKDQPQSRHAIARFWLMVACLFGYALLLEPLGFVLATAALGCLTLILLGRAPLRALVESIIGTLLFRFVFATLLNVQLPESSIELLRGAGL